MVVSRQQMPPTKPKSRPPGTPTHKKRPITTRQTTPPTCVAAPRGPGRGSSRRRRRTRPGAPRGGCAEGRGAPGRHAAQGASPGTAPGGPTPSLCVFGIFSLYSVFFMGLLCFFFFLVVGPYFIRPRAKFMSGPTLTPAAQVATRTPRPTPPGHPPKKRPKDRRPSRKKGRPGKATRHETRRHKHGAATDKPTRNPPRQPALPLFIWTNDDLPPSHRHPPRRPSVGHEWLSAPSPGQLSYERVTKAR